jgi:hypothetical protein
METSPDTHIPYEEIHTLSVIENTDVKGIQGPELTEQLLAVRLKYVTQHLKCGTNPSKEVMHMFRSCVYNHVAYLLAFDFLQHGSVRLRVCLSEVYFNISVARRSHELPKLDETCEMIKPDI